MLIALLSQLLGNSTVPAMISGACVGCQHSWYVWDFLKSPTHFFLKNKLVIFLQTQMEEILRKYFISTRGSILWIFLKCILVACRIRNIQEIDLDFISGIGDKNMLLFRYSRKSLICGKLEEGL